MKARDLWELLKAAAFEWSEDNASRLAAALAYYTVFSMTPLLVIAIGVAGMVFGDEAARGQLYSQLKGVVGIEGASAIQDMIKNANHPTTGAVATITGVLLLIWGASGVFASLQDALNTVWEVEVRPGRGILESIRARFISFGMVLSIGFLLLVSLLLSATLAAAGEKFGGFMAENERLLHAINFLISFVVITLLFATLYKVLPDAKIRWRDVWVGAVVTALLFSIGKLFIGLYLGHSGVTSSFGAAGSFVFLLLWINYSAQIFLFGAEFTQVYATAHGAVAQPAAGAVSLTETKRARQGMPRAQRVQQAMKIAGKRKKT